MDIIVSLFGVGFLAGFVDSIAGGGGLITVPALFLSGLPAHFVLGTNKFQSCFGSLTSALNYRRSKLVSFRLAWQGVVYTLIGATLGAWTIGKLDAELLRPFILILLSGIFLFVLVQPKLGEVEQAKKMSPPLFYLCFGLMLGFYDGFFGPGTGSFWAMAFVYFLGFDLKKATAHTKLMNFTSNIVSFGVFAWFGHINYVYGAAMGAGQLIGAFLGSHTVIKKGTSFVRILFLIIVAITLAKMFYDLYK